MFRQSGSSRAISADIGEIERRLRSLEQQLERVGSRTSASASQAADRVGDAIAAALSGIADRFRGGANSFGDEAAKISSEAAKIGNEAAKLGNDALRRLANEVEHRPLVTLAVAVGVGVLIGLATSHRR
jgi:ElaB/YqjD/DUF883 family membrane-anchored ribosome-binding protein